MKVNSSIEKNENLKNLDDFRLFGLTNEEITNLKGGAVLDFGESFIAGGL